MAEIISIKVEAVGAPKVSDQLKKIKEYVDYLNKTKVTIKAETSGSIDKFTKQITAYNNSVARRVKAETQLATAIENRKAAESRAQAAHERTLQSEQRTIQVQERTVQVAQRAAQANTRLAIEQERTAQTANRSAQAETKLAIEQERTAQAAERSAQAETKLAIEQERTAQAAEKTAQSENKLAAQQERTAQIAAREAAEQRRANEERERGVQSTGNLSTSLAGLVTQVFTLHRILSSVTSAFRDALQTMKDVDSALVTIQKTTGFTGEQLDRVTASAYDLANAYGRTATEVLNAASVYARAGFKDNLDQMTELSVLLQNVGDLESEVASKFLIATNAAWKLAGSYEDLMSVINGLNAQTNQAAVDMEGLTSGITVAGSVFAAAGESVQTFAGMLGTGIALTARSGSEVGRGLRTIAMNIRQIKGELDDGEIIDDESISDAAKALHSIGISAADARGELRLTSDVLDELAGKWNELTTAEQSYISQSLAGKRQANILVSLMQNWDEAQRQMALYANGAGSALQENEIYLDSWEAKTKQLSAAWTQFVSDLVDTDLIKGALDALIKIVNFLDSGFGRFIITVGGVTAAFGALIGVIAKLKVAIGALGLAGAFSPALLAVAAITAGVYALSKAWGNVVTTVEEYDKTAHEAYNTYQSILGEIDALKSKSAELTEQEKTRLTLLEEEARLRKAEAAEQAKQALIGKYSVYNSSYDELQSMLETAPRGAEGPIISAMHKLENGKNLPVTPGGSGVPQYAGMLIGQYLDLQKALTEAKTLDESKELTKQANELKQSIIELATELLDYSEIMGDEFPEDAQSALKYLTAVIDAFDGTRESVKKAKSESEGAVELIALWKEAQELGIDLTKTVFGNIDTNNRQVLEWTSKNLERFKKELESWGYEAEDMIGSISTVMGTSSQYNGVEIAFSPILQTESGPVLLSAETVDKYIFKLIEKAGENWTKEDLLSLDWRGLEVDGTKIQGLLADIGDSAIKTGEAMHYVGKNGALAMAGYKGYADDLLSHLQKVSDAADAMSSAIDGVTEALDGYGEGSLQVYEAMVNLEHTIPGATDGLYDLATASWEVESAEYADKEALLDFINAARQAKLDSLINELERASTAALDLAGSIALALPGGYNDQFLEAYKAENNPALQKLKQQKADWDAYVGAVRDRWSGKEEYSPRDRDTTPTDEELEKRKEAVALLKAELEFLKAKGASESEIVAKQKEIQNALHNQAEYMREIGESQTDIYALSTEWWKIQNEITKDTTDELQQHKDRVSLLKSELSLLEAQGASTDEIVAKQRQIQDALKAQENYMRSIGASQTEINALVTEWYEIENKILKTQQELFDQLKRTIDEYYDAAVNDKKKELEYEEKILAVQKAQIALQNAQNERNVRYFNAASGQWEWGANAKNVQSAKEALSKAQEALIDYQEQAAWAEFKAAWEYIAEQIKSGAVTFAEAYDYMERKMKEIQNKYNVNMSGVLNDSVGKFKGLNKTVKDLDEKTARELGAAVGTITNANKTAASELGKASEELAQQNKNLGEAAKLAVEEFQNAFELVSAKIESGEMTFDEAYEYLKEQAGIIADKYGVDMTDALDMAIAQMDEIYSGLDGISKAVRDGALTPKEAFDIISKALNEVSTQYGKDITGEVNKILKQKGGFNDGLQGLADAVANGEITFDDAWTLLQDAIGETSDLYGIDLQGELDTAIQNMGKSADALDQLWKTIVMNKMRMNSVSWLELDEQEKKAKASGDTNLVKQIQEQKAALHAENEALGNTIGATYDQSGYWSLNGQRLYDPVADKASGEFSGGGGGGGGSRSTNKNQDLIDAFEKHANSGQDKYFIPGLGVVNMGSASADLFKMEAGMKGNDITRWYIINSGMFTPEEATEYLNNGGIVTKAMADKFNSQPDTYLYDFPLAMQDSSVQQMLANSGFNANGEYEGYAIVYGGGAGNTMVNINNGQISVSGLEEMGSNMLVTADGSILRVDGNGHVYETGEKWENSGGSWDSTKKLIVKQLLFDEQNKMVESGNYSSKEVYGKAGLYDSGGVLHGIGGIKATARDEMVLPPDITERLLTPINNGFVRGKMDDLRSMLGMQTEFGSVDNTRIGTQNNGDIYTMNGVTISEGQARVTTVYDLAQMARNLGAYKRS